ncbi:MAG TPA: hypothetical protein VI603_07190, partial [Saprospiraceae bacterium]|nr:hypothetical protein [Saprospiraceae bacterium]
MQKRLILICFVSSWVTYLTGQSVAINNTGSAPDPSSILDISSDGKGLLIPRMTSGQRDNLPDPANGLIVYQTDFNTGFYYNAGTPVTPIWMRMTNEYN